MSRPRTRSRRSLLPSPRSGPAAVAALASLAAVAAVLAATALTPATAEPAGTDLVISEVYGAGGNRDATYDADFVELFNPTDDDLPLTGLSVHYRSAAGNSGGSPYALSGSVPAGGHFLVRMSAPGANGAPLPTPDAVAAPAFSMAAAGGQVFLLRGTTPVTGSGDMSDHPDVVDMVGATSSATSFEGAPTAAGGDATNSLQRSADGADSDDNSADLAPAAPTPTAGGTDQPPSGAAEATIAEIQGTDTAVSPYLGQQVITTGVVTAAYSDGGFSGFYLQTAGTGVEPDATPGASDAIFVYGAAAAAQVAIGEHVQVTGTVAEYAGTTEITGPAVVDLGDPPAAVTPAAIGYPRTEAGREAHEGELLAPTGPFTVTDNYSTNRYGQIGLAAGTEQLWQPTDRADAQDTDAIAEIERENAARGVLLDDGSTANFSSGSADEPMSWLTPGNPVRVGSRVRFSSPVILEYRYDAWRLQPRSPITGDGAEVATFSDTRTPNRAPRDVGGDLRLATMNVLNYFDTTGADWVAAGNACSFYLDRAGDPVTDDTCTGGPTGQGPRGAAEASGGSDLTAPEADLERQRAKIVAAINTMDADIVSLEEIENSVALGETDRDGALRSLVQALNADAGQARWELVASPPAADLPALEDQDVIRTALIYDPRTIRPVGDSRVLVGSPAFDNAREPLAQAFAPVGAPDDAAFAVIVNHFKSKGSGVDDGTGQGNANPDRIAQAEALVGFADEFAADRSTDDVLLTGDFNAYSQEDPIQVLEAAGYTTLASDDPQDVSYQYGGLGGSLDHVLASPGALERVTGTDVWQINAEEAVAFEYSRYNNNATLLYAADVFRASDHNPEVVGLRAAVPRSATRTHLVARPRAVRGPRPIVLTARVRSREGQVTGSVAFLVDDTRVAEVPVEGGRAQTAWGPPRGVGWHRVVALYSGDRAHAGSRSRTWVRVLPARCHRRCPPSRR